MAPNQTREISAPISDLFSISSHTCRPFRTSQPPRMTYPCIAGLTGFALSPSKTYSTLRERHPCGEPTTVPTEVLLAWCFGQCLLTPACLHAAPSRTYCLPQDGEVNRRSNKMLQFIWRHLAHASCQSRGNS